MRRLTINFVLPRPSLAGGIKSNRLIGEAMVRRGHEVNLAFVDQPEPWPRLIQPRRMVRRLVRELRTHGKQRHHLEHSTATLIPVARDRVRPDDVPDADVTIATWWETAEWIRDWPESKGLKAYFIRGYEARGENVERVHATYRLPCLKLVIATWLQRLMRDEFGDDEAVLVPNGVDWDQFDSPPRQKNRRPAVGMLYGRIPLKGPQTGFDAMRIVQQRFPDLRTIAFGSRRIASEHTPPDGLEFHLCPDQREIPELYRSCDCWIVSSTLEGFGMPGLEAAASHCPVVSTRCGGPEDYIRDGESGFLVPVGDAEHMAQRIADVLSLSPDQWSAMSEAGYQIARQFDWDRSAEILEHALTRAVRGNDEKRRMMA